MTRKHYDENGLLHRLDGPAVEGDDGSWVWYRNGKIHCECGPAVHLVFDNNRIIEQFWLNGREIL